jgi:glutamate synthase domain-containing protein 3
MLQRPSELEFLKEVLGQVDDMPEHLAERLVELIRAKPEEDRAQAIRRLIEEHCA